jgi:hypothetical protein
VVKAFPNPRLSVLIRGKVLFFDHRITRSRAITQSCSPC